MKRFKLLNNIFGWVAFAIAAVTYLLTIEPTASFWDCPEFISTAFKLDVGHPPGSPFFMLMGRFFTLFASDTTQVAKMVNSMTALLSAFTILFLFWTITQLARKVMIKTEDDYTTANTVGILAAGMVGALAYTFSDTFWFSAVEGEVYGFSSFFTAIVFWIILKWENEVDNAGSDRWLIFMAYMMGLSTGVHILNLLAIPAIVMVYYFKKHTPTFKGIVLALLAGVGILATVLYGIIPGCIQVACWFELLFVNTFGCSYNTGLYVYIVLLIGFLIWAIYESYADKSYLRMTVSFLACVLLIGIPFFGEHIILGILLFAGMVAFFYYKKQLVTARWINTVLMMITVLLIGYSSYTVIVVRSSAKPTMDQNSPDNVFALKSYFNRDQYGDHPLLYGPVYSAPYKLKEEGGNCSMDVVKGDPFYGRKPKTSPTDKDEYVVTGNKTDVAMDDRFYMLFPRMYSTEPEHVKAYKAWGEITGETINFDYCGQQRSDIKPTFGENLRFFFSYQVNFMYWRYFMWNFAGRQNDLQGHGEIDRGNWITGIGFIDNLLVGDQKYLPSELKNNKGHNTYFLLPLLLGIFGILFLMYGGKKGVEGLWTSGLLFLLTGLAIVIYLNQSPLQPRERDYAYAGSFYAFSIWIGLGVLYLIKIISNYAPKTVTTIAVSISCLIVPVLMAQQNWDDHDRSNRFTCRDFGQNYLASCKPNAIIFTMGDNDTFPLWYAQEVEGKRTDVRVCNLSYLNLDWYIEQMKRGAHESAPLPIGWNLSDYLGTKNEYIETDSLMPQLDLKTAYEFVRSSDPKTKIDNRAFIPATHLVLPVDAEQVIKNGTLPISRASEILPQIDIHLKRDVTKSDLMILEILKENNWKRPVYFAITIGGDYLGLTDHFERTGIAYQILPVGAKDAGPSVNVDEMYDNMMHKFKYGGIDNPKVYLDENTMNMCLTHRMSFVQLIGALLNKGDSVRAKKALDYCNQVIPGTTVRHSGILSSYLAQYYYAVGEPEKANRIMNDVATNCVENIDWYLSLDSNRRNSCTERINDNLGILNQVLSVCNQLKQKSIMDKFLPKFMDYRKRLGI